MYMNFLEISIIIIFHSIYPSIYARLTYSIIQNNYINTIIHIILCMHNYFDEIMYDYVYVYIVGKCYYI